MRRTYPLWAPLLLLLLFPGARTVKSDVDRAVAKFAGIAIEHGHLERLAPYHQLISYFTGIAYFKAHHLVSADFIKALIIAESSGNPRARSSREALGLGQIIHATGSIAARELAATGHDFRYIDEDRLRDLQPGDLFDPAINILLTCYLVAKYNYLYDGRLDLVLTAWNAGENLDSLKQGKAADYRETQELIGKVNGYYLYLLNTRPTTQR